LEIRDIGDLTVDQFRGIFRLTYSGDAHIVLKTKVQVKQKQFWFVNYLSQDFCQANPLNHKQPDIHLMGGSRGMLAAKQPLVVPMLLRLSHFKLNSYVVLVVSKQKGITLVFKTDPLQNVDINSTFDSIAVIQKFIQREIEGQLRQMFREDLPGIIHRLSQQWVKAKVEAPYLEKQPPPVTRRPLETQSMSDMSMTTSDAGLHPQLSLNSLQFRRPRSTSGLSKSSAASTGQHASNFSMKPEAPPPSLNPSSPDSDLENFDPTYGLRPEGLPTKSVFRGFSSLFSPVRGLADLAEEQEPSEPEDEEYDDEDDGAASFDFVNWEYTVPGSERGTRRHPTPSAVVESVPEYETIPAVGGGTVTRPRVYHSQSMIHLPTPNPLSFAARRHLKSTPQTPLSLPLGITTPGLTSRHSGTNSMFATGPHHIQHPSAQSVTGVPLSPSTHVPTTGTLPLRRSFTPDSLETQPSQSSSGHGRTSTPPTSDARDDDDAAIYMHRRRSSISSVTTNANLDNAFSFTTGSSPPTDSPDPKIVLRPALNNSIHQLSTLSHSNHTLSPYTRSLEHFAVRSGPPRSAGVNGGGSGQGGSPGERQQPVKARRKRTFRIGGGGGKGKGLQPGGERQRADMMPTPPSTPDPDTPLPLMPSEFDVGDMDRYFRSFDEHDLDRDHDHHHDIPQHSSPPRKSASATLRQRLPHALHIQRLYTQKYDLHPG
jgi:distribution and morphology protein 34